MKDFFDKFKQLVLKAWERIKPRAKNIAYLLLLEMGISFLSALLIGFVFVISTGTSLLGLAFLDSYSPEMLMSQLLTPGVIIATIVAFLIGLIAIMLYSFISLAYVMVLKENPKISFGELLKNSKAKYWIYFGTLFLSGILVALASLVFVIPGIILAIMYFAVPFIVIETGLVNIAALKSSFEMVKGNAWKVVSNLLAFGLCVGLLSMIFRWFGSIGSLLNMTLPIISLAFSYELYLSLKKATAQTEASVEPVTPETPTQE